MRHYIAAQARTFRGWLLGEAKSEIRAYQQLQWVTRHLRVPIPSTTYSLQPSTISWIVNEILINKRTRILELGAGTSTQIIAQALELVKDDGLDRRLLSIEESEEWTEHVREVIERDGNSGSVTVSHVPRTEGPGGFWYDEQVLNRLLLDFRPDLIVVDGPSIKRSELTADRARVFHFFRDRMAEEYTVFIDDTFRKAERRLIDDWAAYMGVRPTFMNAYLGVATKGEGYSSRPI